MQAKKHTICEEINEAKDVARSIPKLDIVQKEFKNRKEEIEKSLEFLFETNLKITDWDIPEANNKEASEILLEILFNKLNSIKKDVKSGKYNY